ncbi:MAG TPA: LysM domain-containing protein [Ktedonobacteraceae bacterium]|nr:LysM domain-containing protein [Ktedonobacteraceae bacterium]
MATTTYTIKPGDTPASIAARLNIPVDVLIKYNPTIEHNGKRVPLSGNMSLSNGTLYYPGPEQPFNNLPKQGDPGQAQGDPQDPLLSELEGLPGQERDAYAALKTLFDSYDLGSLAPTILRYLQDGFGADTITVLLQQTPEYKARFAGNEQRKQAGLQVLTPAEYLSTEASYKQLLRQNGIDPHFSTEQQFAEWIGKDVSPNELQSRVNMAVQAGTQAPPSVVQYLSSLGIHSGDIASYFLNDQNPTPQLQLKLNQAQIGGAALQNNLQISAADSLRYAQQGVTYQQAQSAYQRIADILPTAQKLSAIYKNQAPVNQGTLQEEFLGNSGTAQLARERLSQQEQATFGGQSGVQKTSFQQQTPGAPTF